MIVNLSRCFFSVGAAQVGEDNNVREPEPKTGWTAPAYLVPLIPDCIKGGGLAYCLLHSNFTIRFLVYHANRYLKNCRLISIRCLINDLEYIITVYVLNFNIYIQVF